MSEYTWTDNPMVSGVSICNTDIVNDNMMFLKKLYDEISFRKIGEIITSTLPISDSGLHLLDGSVIRGEGIYKNFVDYIKTLNTPNICSEADWQTSVNTYGECGYYVYTPQTTYYAWYNSNTYSDIYSTMQNPQGQEAKLYIKNGDNFEEIQGIESVLYNNNTIYVNINGATITLTRNSELNETIPESVRLPKVTGYIEGTVNIADLGKLTEAGLPNIIGDFNGNQLWDGSAIAHGAFDINGSEKRKTPGSGGDGSQYGFNFDASRSSSIYKDNFNKVQTQSISYFNYVVIATTTKTNVEVDFDRVASDLNQKMETDLTNASNNALIKISGLTMPSSIMQTLTLLASGSTYTAPSNGWVGFTITSNGSSGNAYITTIDSQGNDGISSTQYQTTGRYINLFVPISKGQQFKVGYDGCKTFGSQEYDRFVFIYAEGSISEAGV